MDDDFAVSSEATVEVVRREYDDLRSSREDDLTAL